MADNLQAYPDVILRLERDNNGNIVLMEYTINNAGEDNKHIIEFLKALSIIYQSPDGIMLPTSIKEAEEAKTTKG